MQSASPCGLFFLSRAIIRFSLSLSLVRVGTRLLSFRGLREVSATRRPWGFVYLQKGVSLIGAFNGRLVRLKAFCLFLEPPRRVWKEKIITLFWLLNAVFYGRSMDLAEKSIIGNDCDSLRVIRVYFNLK